MGDVAPVLGFMWDLPVLRRVGSNLARYMSRSLRYASLPSNVYERLRDPLVGGVLGNLITQYLGGIGAR